MSFYITISSQNSIICDNSDCRYMIQLPKRISLSEQYEVGLIEISYPNTILPFENQNELKIQISFFNDKSEEEHYDILLPFKRYKSVQDLCDTINEYISDYTEKIKTTYDQKDRTVQVIANRATIIFSDRIQEILGLRHKICQSETIFSYREASIQSSKDFINVCVDIIEPQFFCLRWKPLLRRFLHNNSEDRYIHKVLDPVYFPLRKSDFDTIELHISDDDSHPIVFSEGFVILLIHFRKRR